MKHYSIEVKKDLDDPKNLVLIPNVPVSLELKNGCRGIMFTQFLNHTHVDLDSCDIQFTSDTEPYHFGRFDTVNTNLNVDFKRHMVVIFEESAPKFKFSVVLTNLNPDISDKYDKKLLRPLEIIFYWLD